MFLDGYVEGVADIWVVEASHTQDLTDISGKAEVKRGALGYHRHFYVLTERSVALV